VPTLNIGIDAALGEFTVEDWPDGFSPITGSIQPYDQNVVLRHLSPTATPLPDTDSTMEIYEEGERFWIIDDRWGLAEMNLLKGQWQSWILPQPAMPANQIVQQAVLWPLSQVMRAKGLHLVPAISIARDGWSMLICSPINIEPELSAMVRAGYRVIGQQWTALREEDDHIAMLHLPGELQRISAPQIKAGAAVESSHEWLDINSEVPGSVQNHAFCDAVAIISSGRRPLPAMRQINRSAALISLRQAWPITELHPQRRHSPIPGKLANQCRCYETQLSRRPEDFLKLLDQMRYGRTTPPKVEVTIDAKHPRKQPA
jgi:hypothetical protein